MAAEETRWAVKEQRTTWEGRCSEGRTPPPHRERAGLTAEVGASRGRGSKKGREGVDQSREGGVVSGVRVLGNREEGKGVGEPVPA